MVSTRDGPVRRTARILEAIADAEAPVGVQGLAQQIELPQSTVHRLLQLLCDEGMVAKTERPPRYGVGSGLYRLAAQVVERTSIVKLAGPVLEKVGGASGEACLLALYLPRDGSLTFVRKYDSPHPLEYRVTLNEPLPLVWGASGKAILAHLDVEEATEVINHAKRSPGSGKPIDRAALERELEAIRDAGYGATSGEKLPGAVGIAAPVFDAARRPTASLCLTIPETRFEPSRTVALGELVVSGATELSASLGAPVG